MSSSSRRQLESCREVVDVDDAGSDWDSISQSDSVARETALRRSLHTREDAATAKEEE